MNQFTSGIVFQARRTEPGKGLEKARHGGFEAGEAAVEGCELVGNRSRGIGNSLAVSCCLKDDRAGEIREAAGISQCGNGFEPTEFLVGDAEIDETIANVHEVGLEPGVGNAGLSGRSFAPWVTFRGLSI